MADIHGTRQLLDKFKGLVASKSFQAARDAATELKIKFTQFAALPPLLQPSPTRNDELLLAREALEQSIYLSLHLKDDELFDRNFQQLKVYYTDLRSELHTSPEEALIVGLNLLRLLTQNRVAEFHVELELLSPEVMSSPHVEFARRLEQQLMEGMYSNLLDSIASAPHTTMSWFVEQLRGTIREEVAACAASAYQRLLLKDAASVLGFQTQQDLLAFCASHGWTVDASYVHFANSECHQPEKASHEVFHNMVTYARELDRII